jgi:hypothetical protein
MKLEFSEQIFEKIHRSNFMKILPLGAELFDTDGQADMAKLMTPFAILRNGLKCKNINLTLLCTNLMYEILKHFSVLSHSKTQLPLQKTHPICEKFELTAVYSENLMKYLVHSVKKYRSFQN